MGTADEERIKYGSLIEIIKKLDAADGLLKVSKIEAKKAVNAARKDGKITKAESSTVKAHLGLPNKSS
ncbi:hypothetical protein L917_06533 [Phytophthora nicotianae]|uniref:Uncharacterized protein n=1 Tax=Phytophthora nicotianae TaxID=4792 RepID=W2LE63_PHYNI|nr:hypothetical protein L917_06533 [Phytophthora nicotianae]